MSDLPENLNKQQRNTDITVAVKNVEESFSLNQLSQSLALSAERSKSIYDLYEKNTILKNKSQNLVKALDKEKNINQLQSEFVSLVSHEFRTPLAIIKASADVLLRVKEKASTEMTEKQLEKITNAVQRMSKLIESTLNLSRVESGKLEFKPSNFCLEDLLAEVVERHKDLNHEAKFEAKIERQDKEFYGDRDLIDQIFTNLLTNALKYSKENPHIRVKCIANDNNFHISVTDSGIGMTEKDLSKLFSKFFRAGNTVGIVGTGIGLYLVKQFIELHKGKISAESELDIGTTFKMKLPILT